MTAGHELISAFAVQSHRKQCASVAAAVLDRFRLECMLADESIHTACVFHAAHTVLHFLCVLW